MKKSITLFVVLAFALMACETSTTESVEEETSAVSAEETVAKPDYAIVIHGGAGTILKENMTPEMEADYRSALNEALNIGEEILKAGGKSIDAVTQTIMYLEDSPLFNAGKGSVFTHEEKNELDAAIMNGADLNAGTVAGLTTIKNPITAAKAIMENSKHVMLIGAGAEEFAQEQKLEQVDPSYFFTQRRWDAIQQILNPDETKPLGYVDNTADHKFGTVGCVALDKTGNIVAGTSTGGMTNKRYGRVGDVPIIGAGTYANNTTCGVSATGHGEFFIRYTVAHDISALMDYADMSLQEASDEVVMKKLVEAEGSGGIIAIDHNGNVSMTFNSAGMYRGYAKPNERVVAIYKNE
ncbi:MAG: isoaspartyl peptidase/L-asparaginase [Bacteroidota bacterium]